MTIFQSISMKLNLIDLFRYYRSSLDLENILSVKIKRTKIKEVEQVKFIENIKSEFNNQCIEGKSSFNFKLAAPFDEYILLHLSDCSASYDKCFEELSFLEKTLNYCENNRRILNTSSDLENNDYFAYPEINAYQYNIFLNLIASQEENNKLIPIFILTFKSTDLDNTPIKSGIIFEQIKKYMGQNYDHEIDTLSLPSPNLFINPYLIEDYECSDINFEFNNYKELEKNTSAYIQNTPLLIKDKDKITFGQYLCAIDPSMSHGLVRIYNQVITDGPNKLLNEYFSIHPNKKSNIKPSKIYEDDILTSFSVLNAYSQHIGAFDSKYSLAETQRIAMSCFLNSKNSVLPINGAPGTGKTSLLRCIFGQYLVDSAIESYNEYIKKQTITFRTPIVCSSTNNQALYNISEGVESGFSDQIRNYPDNVLYKRWIRCEINTTDNKAKLLLEQIENKPVVDLSKQLFVPSIKNKKSHNLELNKFDLISIIKNVSSYAENYLEKFTLYKPNHLDTTASIHERLQQCADYFYQKIRDNNKAINKIVNREDFLELAKLEKEILIKYSEKYQLLDIQRSLLTVKKNASLWHKKIESLNDAEAELENIRESLRNYFKNICTIFSKVSNNCMDQTSIENMLAVIENFLNNDIKQTTLYKNLVSEIFKSLWNTKLNELTAGFLGKKAACKFSANVLDKIFYLFKYGKLYNQILKFETELKQNTELAQKEVLINAENTALTLVEKELSEILNEIKNLEIKHKLKLNEEQNIIDEISTIKKYFSNLIVFELDDIKKLVQLDSIFNNLDNIIKEQSNFDTKERTDNFYYALHLLEALFFIKHNSSNITCPCCKNQSLFALPDESGYKCNECNARYSKNNPKNPQLSDKEIEMIFKFQGYFINNKYYQAECSSQSGQTWINIKSGGKPNTEIDFNSILPVFPMINLTCNSFGNIVANKNGGIPKDLFDFVLIDEAGTILPSKMIILYCAKRCMLFGDAKQLKPVFNYSSQVELKLLTPYISSLENRKVVNEYFSCGTDSQIPIYANNAILVGNNCCQIILPYNASKLEGDIWLKEHYRCKDPIIEISNILTYEGEIIPKAGSDGYLFFVESQGIRSDNKNKIESEMIVNYIKSEKNRLCKLLNTPNLSDEEYYNSIGIITPFRNQEYQIATDLKDLSSHVVPTVGTVHKFQGSERKIIIFSTVYDEGTPEKLFFNREDTSMINVAVTRAKNIFICFGRLSLLKKPNTHSGKMVAKILEHERRDDK